MEFLKNAQKGKKAVKPVKKPYMKGKPLDASCTGSCVKFALSLLLVALVSLFASPALLVEAAWMRYFMNGAVLLLVYGFYYQTGAGKGVAAVNQGEILHQREAEGKTVDAKDRAACFHYAKGFMIGLVGALPWILCAAVLAMTAQRQMTHFGALPSWVGGFESRAEIGDAVAYYSAVVPMTLEDALRIVVRMVIMPFINMTGLENKEAHLLLERISPLLMLLPVLSYGLGYARGVELRSRVHTSIAQNKRKQARREKKRREARARAFKTPEQLN